MGITALALALALLPSARGRHADTDPPFVVEHLDLRVRLDLRAGTMTGDVRLRLRNAGSTAATRVSLLLNRGLAVDAASAADGSTLLFRQEQTAFADLPSLVVTQAVVSLDRPVAPGTQAEIHVGYGGRLRSYAHTGMRYIADSITPAFTILRRDAYAFPLPGLPDLKAIKSAPTADFTYEVQVAVPATHVAATGGRDTGRETGDGGVTWRSRSLGRAPYLIVTVAPYRVLERGGVRIVHFPTDSAGAVVVADRVAAALERFGRWFGPLPVAPTFTIMEIPDGFGSQASLTGGIIQTAAAFADRDRLVELYHELSHLWNASDLDRPSPRWNEGLATFLQYRVAAELDGRDLGASMQALVERLGTALQREPRLASVPLARFGEEGMTDHAYRLGAVLFGLLFETLGPARFDAAYRGLFQEHTGTGLTVDDLHRAFDIEPAASRILHDWLSTTAWTGAIAAGKTFQELSIQRPGA